MSGDNDFDLLLTDATIVDGSGRPPYKADLAAADGVIVATGNFERATADEMIDCNALTVIPGIVDCHAHSDLTLLADPRGQSKIQMGVTTELNGQCGLGVFPVRPEDRAELASAVSFIAAPVEWTWESADDYLRALDRARPAYSAGIMVGHGSLRSYVMGFEGRAPSDEELARMQDALRASLAAGCFGLSFGFEYAPGFFADDREVLALLEVIAEREKLISVHTRSQREEFTDAIREIAALCVQAQDHAGGTLRLQIDHLKRSGQRCRGTMAEPLQLIEDLREGGLDIAFDVFPYIAGSKHLAGSLPRWVHDGGSAAMLERIAQPETRERLRKELAEFQAGERDSNPFELDFDRILITDVGSEANAAAVGRKFDEVAAERGEDPVDAYLNLLIEEQCRVSAVFFSMSEEGMREALVHPLGAVATDGLAFAPSGPARLGNPHPRSYGTYPRLLGHYVRDEGLMPIEEAVRKCT